jgi:hypothetical protein
MKPKAKRKTCRFDDCRSYDRRQSRPRKMQFKPLEWDCCITRVNAGPIRGDVCVGRHRSRGSHPELPTRTPPEPLRGVDSSGPMHTNSPQTGPASLARGGSPEEREHKPNTPTAPDGAGVSLRIPNRHESQATNAGPIRGDGRGGRQRSRGSHPELLTRTPPEPLRAWTRPAPCTQIRPGRGRLP